MILLGLLFLATRSSGYDFLRRQDAGPGGPASNTAQDVSDMCDACPEMRSLISILWSCASTLFLATWVSVHPNVPPPRTSFFRMAIIRFGMMTATIIGPEFILVWAAVQRKLAGKIHSNPKFQDQGNCFNFSEERSPLKTKHQDVHGQRPTHFIY